MIRKYYYHNTKLGFALIVVVSQLFNQTSSRF